jgi:hypothetical protein
MVVLFRDMHNSDALAGPIWGADCAVQLRAALLDIEACADVDRLVAFGP